VVRTRHGRIVVVGVFLGCSLAPAAAGAAGETKFEGGLRSGYGVPLGKASADATLDMSAAIAGQIPIWLDVGARIRERVFLGASFSYGFGFLGSTYSETCKELALGSEVRAEVTCSSKDIRLGASALYHFGPPDEIHAWLGGGIGYEWWSLSQSVTAGGQNADLSVTAHGFELLNLQVGGDFPLGQYVALAPFVAFTLAQFGRASGACSGDCAGITTNSVPIEQKSLHEWLFFGVRAAFLP
jgi:hypothetical protein